MAIHDTNIKDSEIGREKGGEASPRTEKLSASELTMYLKGVNFPCDKMGLVEKVRSNGAPDKVVDYLNRLPERQYTNPMEIEQEFNKVK
jgi:hypothetical protein